KDTLPKDLENWWVRGTTDTADFFGVSAQTLSDWEKRGAPKEGYGKWDIRKLVDWKFRGEQSAEARRLVAEAKFKEAKANMAVMNQAVMEGKYIEKSEVDRSWTTIGTQMKANILAWVRILTPALANQDMRTVEKIMTEATYDLLEQVSSKGKYTAGRVSKGT
ncbi:MAG: hypothetical protein ACRDBM_08630, partial [Sporomusa sp.]